MVVTEERLHDTDPYTITNGHGSNDRALRLLELATKHWTRIPVDDHGQLPPAALRAALEAHDGAPTILVLQAGDVNTGALPSTPWPPGSPTATSGRMFPLDCGYAFVNQPEAHAGALGLRVSYIATRRKRAVNPTGTRLQLLAGN